MPQDLRALFKLDQLDVNPNIMGRAKLAQAILLGAKEHTIVNIQMPHQVAAEMARDLLFAISQHPFGVPDDVFPPDADLLPSIFSAPNDDEDDGDDEEEDRAL